MPCQRCLSAYLPVSASFSFCMDETVLHLDEDEMILVAALGNKNDIVLNLDFHNEVEIVLYLQFQNQDQTQN